MEITFHGHACLTVAGAGDPRRVVLDPYRPGALGGRIRHGRLVAQADVITVSHWHVDHSHISADLETPSGGRPPVVDRSGEAAGLRFDVRFTYHDRHHGTKMGLVGMVAFELDGLRVAHLGDVGCPISEEDARALGPVDVLIWPVGGVYTLGPDDAASVLEALRPRIALPVHYDNEGCRLGLATIDALEPALRSAGSSVTVRRAGRSTWTSAGGLPARGGAGEVLVLEPGL